MSTIFIHDIIGTGVFGVPADDAGLLNANTGLNLQLSHDPAVAGLSYETLRAWVKDYGGPGGVEGARSLNCQLSGVLYNTEECPDETETDTLEAAIRAALITVQPFGVLSSVGTIEFTLVNYFPID